MLDQEDETPAESVCDKVEIEEKTKPSVMKSVKINKLMKEFNQILTTTPDKIGDVALDTWYQLGPFDLQKHVDTLEITVDESVPIKKDMGYQCKPY